MISCAGRRLLIAVVLLMASGTGYAERPNLILIMADDLGWGDLRCFNPSSPIETPHLDAMAAGGMRFTRFYAAAPVCSPTRGSCLTGRHPFRYRIFNANSGHLPEDEENLAQLLADAGYSTGHFGKWHLGTLTTTVRDSNRGRPGDDSHFAPPQSRGFSVCFSTEAKVPTCDPLWKPKRRAASIGWARIPDGVAAVRYGTRFWDESGREIEDDLKGDDSRLIMDRALEHMKSSVGRQEPFFSVIWFHAPHLPVVAEERHRRLYPDHSLYHSSYFGCVTALDEQIGRLRASLREWGIERDTVLFFCSDNGPEGKTGKAPGSGGPLRGRKRSLYEGGVRVPGLVEWPGVVVPGSVSGSVAVTSDYFPTITEIAGIERRGNNVLDGRSLTKALRGGKVPSRFIGFRSGGQSAWTGDRYKLYRGKDNKPWELYDLSVDPSETTDKAVDEPDRVLVLAQDARRWIDSLPSRR